MGTALKSNVQILSIRIDFFKIQWFSAHFSQHFSAFKRFAAHYFVRSLGRKSAQFSEFLTEFLEKFPTWVKRFRSGVCCLMSTDKFNPHFHKRRLLFWLLCGFLQGDKYEVSSSSTIFFDIYMAHGQKKLSIIVV